MPSDPLACDSSSFQSGADELLEDGIGGQRKFAFQPQGREQEVAVYRVGGLFAPFN